MRTFRLHFVLHFVFNILNTLFNDFERTYVICVESDFICFYFNFICLEMDFDCLILVLERCSAKLEMLALL